MYWVQSITQVITQQHFSAFITRFHKNDMNLQNSFITMQIRKVKRSTFHSSNIKKTACHPFNLASFHGTLFGFYWLFHNFQFFWISKYFDLSITEETWLVEMRIWYIKIGIVLVLHFNPWVEDSAGGVLVPEGLYNPVAKYFGTCFKLRIELLSKI
jgi:hypothetical protein